MKNLIRLFLLIGLSFGLTSCSRLNWAVRFADFFLTGQIDDFVDLTSSQRKETKAELAKIIRDIRAEDFPKLAGLLEKTHEHLPVTQALDKEQLDGWHEELMGLVKSSLRRFEPLALSLNASSGSEQEIHFRKEASRRTEKLRKDVSDPKRALKKDKERALRWIEFFVTDLSSEQTKFVEAFAESHPVDFQAELENRDHLLSSFLKSQGDERREWIRRLFEDPDSLRPAASVNASKKRQEAMKELFLQLWDRLSEKQRMRVKENLKEKAAEFRRLSQ
ncbi:MAG: hypothetical protein KF789_08600 [Bdellovibrionaceae bacterium]|nr:hypothetical protein [Pseudobdellovibrionaceae bacterium]